LFQFGIVNRLDPHVLCFVKNNAFIVNKILAFDYVQPRRRNNKRRSGTGTPISQRRIQPSFPLSAAFFETYFII